MPRLRALHCIMLLTCLICTLRWYGSIPAVITHSCTCYTCIPTISKPPCMHTYIYTCRISNAQLCLHDQLHACMRMPHMHRSHIDFLTIRASRTPLSSFRCLRFLIERRYNLKSNATCHSGIYIYVCYISGLASSYISFGTHVCWSRSATPYKE